MSPAAPLASSFRDPSGFVFVREGTLYRQVNAPYARHLEHLTASGLHDELVGAGLLVRAERDDLALAARPGAVAVLRPERVPLVSYPYEWCFGMLRDAALLTLEICRRALQKGMILKDASAYNVQFLRGRSTLIDTLSFEIAQEGAPWVAYRQFCRHFLAPLALMARVDVRLGSLLRTHLDGVPLDLASRLLGRASWLRGGLLAHLHLHAQAESRPASPDARTATVTQTGLLALLDSLRGTVESLRWEPKGTEWSDYYADTNYTAEAMTGKRELVAGFLDEIVPAPASCWDLGANTGEFSEIAAARGVETVAWDSDPAAVEKAYRKVRETGQERLLPLLQDLANPSPSQGWASKERDSLASRGPADAVMALALVHHLAITHNVPLPSFVRSLATLGRWAILEFVPKEDSQVRRMLASREDVFADYHEPGLEAAVAGVFDVVRKVPLEGTHRTLYLLRRCRD